MSETVDTTLYFRGKKPPRPSLTSTGSRALDSLLNRSERGGVVQISGADATGKSQILFSVAAREAAARRRTLFVDTQGKFRPERVLEISRAVSSLEDPLSSIDVLSTDSPERILLTVEGVTKTDRYTVLMIDDFSEPYLRGGYGVRNTALLSYTMRQLATWAVLSGRNVLTVERLKYDPVLRMDRPLGIEFTCPYISSFLRLEKVKDMVRATDVIGQKRALFRIGESGVKD